MKKILIINSSATIEGSYSRALSTAVRVHIQKKGYAHLICFRDLDTSDILHVNQKWIRSNDKPSYERSEEDNQVLKASDLFIEELREADIVILATPMYNWSIPSSLKAYIDQIMRFKETFILNPESNGSPYIGMLSGKSLYLLLSRGGQGYNKGERNEHMDFQSHYLKMIFGLLGFQKIHELALNGTKLNTSDLDKELTAQKLQLCSLLDHEFIQ